MAIFSTRNPKNRLFSAAKSCLSLGYSVIPVQGDRKPESAKLPLMPWKAYQSRKPQITDLEQWFAGDAAGGLAIITGHVSGLFVLDFDDPDLADEFACRHPDLIQTRTVLSAGRGTPHYYYHLMPGQTVPSRRAEGVDLQSDGRYVIAPPTTIGGKAYHLERGGMPRILSKAQIGAILRFVDEYSVISHEAECEALSAPIKPVNEHKTIDSISHLQALYQQRVCSSGRNAALFDVSLKARDSGWMIDDVIAALTETHAQQPARTAHHPESSRQRRIEARSTIHSAFSRPPRQKVSTEIKAHDALPNSLREAFLKQGQTCVVRVIDGLLLAGVVPGELLTEARIREFLADRVGRHSILQALKALNVDNSPVFVPIDPSPKPPTPANAAEPEKHDQEQKCFLFRATKPDKKHRGRPPCQFVMPCIDVLCKVMGVKYTRSDSIVPDDLRSVRRYRQALHREFIKRRPGQYDRGWLARRLGVSVRTFQRYNDGAGVRVKAMYDGLALRWDQLNQIHDYDVRIDGTFLQDASGKRYPPQRSIAAHLLKQRQTVLYMVQTANYYSYRDQQLPTMVTLGMRLQTPEISPESVDKAVCVKSDLKVSKNAQRADYAPLKRACAVEAPHISAAGDGEPEPVVRHTKRRYHRPLPDDGLEQVAQRLYQLVDGACSDKSRRLSQPNCRRLIDQYGAARLNDLMYLLKKRSNVRNPAGFAVMYLRSGSQAV